MLEQFSPKNIEVKQIKGHQENVESEFVSLLQMIYCCVLPKHHWQRYTKLTAQIWFIFLRLFVVESEMVPTLHLIWPLYSAMIRGSLFTAKWRFFGHFSRFFGHFFDALGNGCTFILCLQLITNDFVRSVFLPADPCIWQAPEHGAFFFRPDPCIWLEVKPFRSPSKIDLYHRSFTWVLDNYQVRIFLFVFLSRAWPTYRRWYRWRWRWRCWGWCWPW